ncbi:hypothetical protein ACTQ5K_20020 [Niallia sp. Sow4_A1]|uniref:Uncharacterized protein n=1 Tax=Niallia hominis TaxID=3133173 RepID=A0ABV1F1V4_9BACI
MYKSYAIEIPKGSKCHFASEEVELMNSILDFEPIYKYAIGKNNECFNAKVYANDEGKPLLGYLVHYSIEDCRAGIDGSNTQMKEIYLLPEGRFVKFYTLMEDNLVEDGQHNRLNRILLVDQGLTDGEIEAIFDHLSGKF